MISLFCPTEEQTRRLGFCLGACLHPGDVVLLCGEMGAGKSVLVRAAAQGMGVEGPVPSPTFTIMNVHEGRAMRLYHFDLYRLEDADAFYELGLYEQLPPDDGAAMIEWPQMCWEAMPADALCIKITVAEDGRHIELIGSDSWDDARLDALARDAL